MENQDSLFSEDEPVDGTMTYTTDYETASIVTIQPVPRYRYYNACRICGKLHQEQDCPIRHELKCYGCGQHHVYYRCPLYYSCPVCSLKLQDRKCACGYPKDIRDLDNYVQVCWKCGKQHSALVCPDDLTKMCPSCGRDHDFRYCSGDRLFSRLELGIIQRQRLLRRSQQQKPQSRFAYREMAPQQRTGVMSRQSQRNAVGFSYNSIPARRKSLQTPPGKAAQNALVKQ